MKERSLHLAKGVNERKEFPSSLGKECEVERFLLKAEPWGSGFQFGPNVDKPEAKPRKRKNQWSHYVSSPLYGTEIVALKQYATLRTCRFSPIHEVSGVWPNWPFLVYSRYDPCVFQNTRILHGELNFLP